MPRLALHEIQQALAACQEQAREEAFQRGKRQEHEQKTKESSHRAGREGHREKQHKPELPPKKEASGKATVQASQENLQSGPVLLFDRPSHLFIPSFNQSFVREWLFRPA